MSFQSPTSEERALMHVGWARDMLEKLPVLYDGDLPPYAAQACLESFFVNARLLIDFLGAGGKSELMATDFDPMWQHQLAVDVQELRTLANKHVLHFDKVRAGQHDETVDWDALKRQSEAVCAEMGRLGHAILDAGNPTGAFLLATDKSNSRYADDHERLMTDLAGELEDFANWAADFTLGPLRRPTPGSDLARDAEKLGRYAAYPIVAGSLLSASDHLHAFRDSLVKSLTVYAAASVTSLRGALEPAALALWMVQPDDQADRFKRALRAHFGSLDRFRAYKTGTGATDTATKVADRLEEIKSLAEVLLGPGARIGSPSTAELLNDIGDGAYEDLWRLSSGIAHGLDWAKLAGFHIAATRNSGDRTPDLYLVADLDLIRRLARTVHQLYEAALTAYQKRAITA